MTRATCAASRALAAARVGRCGRRRNRERKVHRCAHCPRTACAPRSEAVVPQCERSAGRSIELEFGTSASIRQRMSGGEAVDLAFITTPVVDGARAGRASRRQLDHARWGVPASVSAFARAVAGPRSARPTRSSRRCSRRSRSRLHAEGASRPHLERMFERLGIAAEMQAKTLLEPGSVQAAEKVVAGEAEILLTLVSEILPVEGMELARAAARRVPELHHVRRCGRLARHGCRRGTRLHRVRRGSGSCAGVRRGGHRAVRALAVVATAAAFAPAASAHHSTALVYHRDGAHHRSRRRDHRSRVGQSARALQDARRGRRRRRACLGYRVELREHGEPLRAHGRARRGRQPRQSRRQRRAERRQRPLAHEHDAAERPGDSVRRGREAALVASRRSAATFAAPSRRTRAISGSFASGPMRRTRPRSGATTCR